MCVAVRTGANQIVRRSISTTVSTEVVVVFHETHRPARENSVSFFSYYHVADHTYSPARGIWETMSAGVTEIHFLQQREKSDGEKPSPPDF